MTHVVPCGRSDLPGLDTVKLFCPNCNDIYTPPSSRFQGVDGVWSPKSIYHQTLTLKLNSITQGPSLGPPLPIYSSRATVNLRQHRSGSPLQQVHPHPQRPLPVQAAPHLVLQISLSTPTLMGVNGVRQVAFTKPRFTVSR